MEKIKCIYCNSDAEDITDLNNFDKEYARLIECPCCGRYKYACYPETFGVNERDMVASYLFYNGIHGNVENRKIQYIWLDSKEHFAEAPIWYRNVTLDEIVAFNSITLSEKITLVLQNIALRSNYYGDHVKYSMDEIIELLFINKWQSPKKCYELSFLYEQIVYLLSCVERQQYITYKNNERNISICLQPNGWNKVEETQRLKKYQRNVFVAMSFAADMKDVRGAIKKAITECGYIPRIMDEIEHNHQIVPEMLYEIRQAKFVIAELTGHNNGAYFEAGYALGQNKEVIQLCRKDTFGADGHFDVKQINTILWEDCNDLTEKLINRIKATIE